MTARKYPVVEFSVPIRPENAEVVQALDILREALGRVSSLVTVVLLWDSVGVVVAGAPSVGVEIGAARTALDFEDARLDTFRVVAYGVATAAGTHLRVTDNGSGLELCRVVIPSSVTRMVGEWVQLPVALGGERSVSLWVVGNGSANHTLYNVHLHARTTHSR